MKNNIKIGFLFILSFLLNSNANGQVELGSLIKDKWITLAEQAIEQSFLQVRVEYVLQEVETGYQYGRGKLEYFNRVYTSGILADDLIWMNQKTFLTPWKDDPLFSGYKDDKKYKPVVSAVTVLGIDDTEYSKVEVNLQDSVISKDWAWVGLNHSMKDKSSSLIVMSKDEDIENYALGAVLKSSDVKDDEIAKLDLKLRLKELREPIEGQKITFSIESKGGNAGVLLCPVAQDGAIVFKVYGLIHNTTSTQAWTISRITPNITASTDLKRIGETPRKRSELIDEYRSEPDSTDVLTPKTPEEKTEEKKEKKKKRFRLFRKKTKN